VRATNYKMLIGLVIHSWLLALCSSAEAQNVTKHARIGFLTGVDQATGKKRFQEFRQAVRELGYIDGHNVVLIYRNPQEHRDRLPEIVAEVVREKVDVIVVAAGLPILRAVKSKTNTIPIIMAGRGIDPVVAGLVESLARPGANITGITNLSRELGGKRLELLKDTAREIKKVGVLYESANAGSLRELKHTLPAPGRVLGLTLLPHEVLGPDHFEAAFKSISKERPEGLYVTSSPLMTANLKPVASFSANRRLPSIGSSSAYAEHGGLLSYDSDDSDTYRKVAVYVDKILKGVKPADLPIEQPTKFELVINLKTAKQIGLTIPSSVLARADKVLR
jgi:putative tryptophan/tyrosine transport system substrate-binding protein